MKISAEDQKQNPRIKVTSAYPGTRPNIKKKKKKRKLNAFPQWHGQLCMNSRGVFSRLVKGEAAGRTEVDGWIGGCWFSFLKTGLKFVEAYFEYILIWLYSAVKYRCQQYW